MPGDWDPNASWRALRTNAAADVGSAYSDLGARCPVARVDGVLGGFWAVLSHDDLVAAALDTDAFSNVVPLFGTRRPPLECDPPEHRLYRRLLNPFFSRKRMEALEGPVRRYAVEMIDPMVRSGEADFAQRLALPFPTRVLCRLLGAPDADWEIVNRWGAAVDRLGGQSPPGSPERLAAGAEIEPYMIDLIRQRREDPGDDIVSGLIHGDPDLPPLDDEPLLGIVMMLLSAGHNTTASALGNLVHRIARDGSLQTRLRADTASITAAVEESVRLDAPQQAMRRVATRDTELGGRAIAAGDWVWLVFGSANVDPAAFPSPTSFDLDRSPNRHVGFGRGIHLCVGAPLARLQVRVVVEELLGRTSAVELAGPSRRADWPRLGFTSLPIRLR
jgi:cytochrome P450